MKITWKRFVIGLILLAFWPLTIAVYLAKKGYQVRQTRDAKYYFAGAAATALIIFPLWIYVMENNREISPAPRPDQPAVGESQPRTQTAQPAQDLEPKVHRICYTLSDSRRDEIYESKDYFAWNVGVEKCNSPINEEDVREYYMSLDYQYCRYPSIRIAVEFENVESLDPSSVRLFHGNKIGMFGTNITDILEWYDFSNDLEESGLTENGLFVNGTYYITVASGTSQDTFTLEDNESEKLYGENGSFEATLFYKSNSNNEYQNTITLPFMNPYECAAKG